jgi:hypothetical protein
MGYVCPVCGDPQADAVHLANHLALTALARGGDHEEWLDERVPEWEQFGEERLGERLVDHADEAEFPRIFEDTTGAHADHGDDPADAGAVDVGGARSRADDVADWPPEDAADILEEARELTRRRWENADDSETE